MFLLPSLIGSRFLLPIKFSPPVLFLFYHSSFDFYRLFFIGSTGCFGTHVERKSGYLIVFRIDDRQDNAFNTATIKAFSSVPDKLKKSFTVDNGKEFAAHKELSDATGMKAYFCDPYSPWQRGTNENTNGLLRQIFSKGTSFANISYDDLQHIVDLINNCPRKRLGFRTPLEVLYKFFR